MKGKSKDQIKPRNNGQWTEGRFRGFVTATLRAGMRRWPPKWAVKEKAKVGIKLNRRTGRKCIHYLCASCGNGFPNSLVQVDHILPVGSSKTWDEYIERLFCEAGNLQVLCKACHKKKTKIDNQANRSRPRRKHRSNTSTGPGSGSIPT